MKINNIIDKNDNKRTIYSGYFLSSQEKIRLLQIFPPKYNRTLADHITYEFGPLSSIPPESRITIIGYTDSNDGLEALICSINGEHVRNDGSTYHITWSLDGNYKPVDSNRIISERGWVTIDPIQINTVPKVIKAN